MSRTLETIKPSVRALRAYTLSPDRASVKINQNENPFDAPQAIKEETLRRLENRSWSRYPDFVPASLNERLSTFAQWNREGVLVGNGSNELIQALLMVTISAGKKVLIAEPTFALYRQVTSILGGEVLSVPLTDEFQFDVPALRQSIKTNQPDVLILCSPNNPTGCVISDSDLKSLLNMAPGLVVIDEAYHEFSNHSVVPLLEQFENLVVLRTFSKAMALAAFRVGYLLGAPGLVTEVRKAVLPYNLNAFSQAVAEVAIEMYESELAPLVKTIIAERDRLHTAIASIRGFVPVASHANFMIIRGSDEPKQIFQRLLEGDILIRDVSSYPMLSQYFRVSVGTSDENDLLIGALRLMAEDK